MSQQRLIFFLTVILSLGLSSCAVTSFMPTNFASSRTENNLSRRNSMARFRGGSDDPFQGAEAGAETPGAQPVADTSASASNTVASQSTPYMPESTLPSESQHSQPTDLLGPNAAPAGPIRKALPSFPWHKLPNYLTFMRCFAIPILVYMFYRPDQNILTAFLFASASLTDWFDGYLARRWDISSPFGAFLDPVADKLMVSTSLVLLTGRYGPRVAIPAAIILAREIAVSALREWMATRGARDTVKVGLQGKVKTALTMVALTMYLAVPLDGAGALGKLMRPAEIMLYASALITVTSGAVYFQAAAPVLLSSKKSLTARLLLTKPTHA